MSQPNITHRQSLTIQEVNPLQAALSHVLGETKQGTPNFPFAVQRRAIQRAGELESVKSPGTYAQIVQLLTA